MTGSDIEQPEQTEQETALIQTDLDIAQALADQITTLSGGDFFDELLGFAGVTSTPVTTVTQPGTTTVGTELTTTDPSTGETLRAGDFTSSGDQIVRQGEQLGILGGDTGDTFRPFITSVGETVTDTEPVETTTQDFTITDQGEFLSGQLADLEEAIGPLPTIDELTQEAIPELSSEQLIDLGIPLTDVLDPETGETRPATMDELLSITERTATEGVQNLLEGNFADSPAGLALDQIIEEERAILDQQLIDQLGSPSAAALSTAGIQQETEFAGEVIKAEGDLFLAELDLLNDIALGRTSLNQAIEESEFEMNLAATQFLEEASQSRSLLASGLESQRLDDIIQASLGPFGVISADTSSSLDALSSFRSDTLSADIAESESGAAAASGAGELFGSLLGSGGITSLFGD